MTSRARSKAYKPVLATVHKWTDAAVIFKSVETQRTFMVPQSVCLIQTVDNDVIALNPVPGTDFTAIAQGEIANQGTCIVWVPEWKLFELKEKGEEVPVMTPPTPKARS